MSCYTASTYMARIIWSNYSFFFLLFIQFLCILHDQQIYVFSLGYIAQPPGSAYTFYILSPKEY